MQAPALDQLFLTALPNGMPDSNLRLSVLLTPSLQSTTLRDPFKTWPVAAEKLKFVVTFRDINGNAIGNAVKAQRDGLSTLDADMWAELFRGEVPIRKRKGNNHMHRTWRLSHNIGRLRNGPQMQRLATAYGQMAANGSIQSPANATPADLHGYSTPPKLFLHPGFSNDLAARYDDRVTAIQDWNTMIVTTLGADAATVTKRAAYGIKHLEAYGGASLSAISLAAVYTSCLQSAQPAAAAVPAITAAIARIRSIWLAAGFFHVTYADLDVVRDHVEMILFHRRVMATRNRDNIPRPDFHQILGLVHNYPAIMRPLGLVLDLIVQPPPGLIPGTGARPCSATVDFDTSDADVLTIAGQIALGTPPKTWCTVGAGVFFATPKEAGLIQNGLLNLRARSASSIGGIRPPRFLLVPENADNQTLKATDQVNNADRGEEYKTSAPTSITEIATVGSTTSAAGMAVITPPATANPSTASAAPQTIGLALFDQDRLIKMEHGLANVPPTVNDQTSPSPPSELFAEDLVLGYRVDILYQGKFYSLCERQSKYKVIAPGTTAVVKVWAPGTDKEKIADEGFVSFSATQSSIDDQSPDTQDSATTQTQVHQSMFTWTGWSLSVPQPGIPTLNQDPSPASRTEQANSQWIAIRPTFDQPDNSKLPPLRFNGDYIVRCRVADLAGNGIGVTTDPANTQFAALSLQPSTPFSRHEPFRPPHFLLLHAIDRKKEPGTHVDRIVARDNQGGSSRMLVPPRESLRLAELSGFLKDDQLPKSAFSSQQLMDDGSFPSVGCAKEKNWIGGTAECPADNDPIFLGRRIGNKVQIPYYPDPRSNFIRFQVLQVTDDPKQSLSLGEKYLEIGDSGNWPQRLPVRVRLIPEQEGANIEIDDQKLASIQEKPGLFGVPTLDVKLPQGRTVILRVSTAETNDPNGDGAVPVHLFHLANLHRRTPDALSDLFTGKARDAAHQLGLSLQGPASNKIARPGSFVDGTLHVQTPARTMTLVHAVRKPLFPPEFCDGGAGSLKVVRDPGKSEAHVSGGLKADWLSTGKIVCHAKWTDKVDDVSRKDLQNVQHHDVAFTVTVKELMADSVPGTAVRCRAMKALTEHFNDTRAHEIQYSLVAATNFREYYYPPADAKSDESGFQTPGTKPVSLTVLSSVCPPAPAIRYLIPAFAWTNVYEKETKTWRVGRTVVLRAYFERPFLVSGNRETAGVILFDPDSGVPPAKQTWVSRWGADPTRPVTAPVKQNELSEANLCEADHPILNCTLPGKQKARVKVCSIHYSGDRNAWYTDIPINTLNANAPFVRLAFARWQPDALQTPVDLRPSDIVFAEFMQVSPDRWVSVQKLSGSKYKITIYGAFPKEPDKKLFNLTLYSRWYAMSRDTGWREVKSSADFKYSPPDGTGISSWSTELTTPHSANLRTYRVLLRENESGKSDAKKSFLSFVYLP